MGNQNRVIFQHHLLDNVGLGLDCAAFQFMIGVKPAPQKKEGERHSLCLARGMSMGGTGGYSRPQAKGGVWWEASSNKAWQTWGDLGPCYFYCF